MISARPIAVGGAAHVLLHRAHGRGRLDVEAAGVEADALADQRDLRRILATPGEIEEAGALRRRRPRPRSSVQVRGAEPALPRITRSVAPRRRRAPRRRPPGLPGLRRVRRRVDEILGERRATGDGFGPGEVDAGGTDELGLRRLAGPVAVEAVVGEAPAEGLDRQVDRHPARLERVASRRKLRRGGGEGEAVAGAGRRAAPTGRATPPGPGRREPRRSRPRSRWPSPTRERLVPARRTRRRARQLDQSQSDCLAGWGSNDRHS